MGLVTESARHIHRSSGQQHLDLVVRYFTSTPRYCHGRTMDGRGTSGEPGMKTGAYAAQPGSRVNSVTRPEINDNPAHRTLAFNIRAVFARSRGEAGRQALSAPRIALRLPRRNFV